MDNKIRDIIYITDYLTKCKIDDPNSEKSELARSILNSHISKLIRSNQQPIINTPKKYKYPSFLSTLLSIIF
jgi:hypothetical protein